MAMTLDRPESGPVPRELPDFRLTGPGTLSGRYMRTFWHPIYVAAALPAGRAAPIRIMSEDFTLYRGESGKPQVVAARCAHRGTQLSTGWVEDDCIRCFYHGWKYEPSGQCVEMPAEEASFPAKVRINSYPTQEYLGLIFAYLGEGEAPPLPRFSTLEEEGVLASDSYFRGCNVFNNLESNTDELHVAFVHRTSFASTGLNRDLPQISGEETEYGFVKYGTRSDGVVRVSHFFWPNALYIKGSPDVNDTTGWTDHVGWRVPIDDESHLSFNADLVHVTGDAVEAVRARLAEKKRKAPGPDEPTAAELGEAVLRGELHTDDLTQRPDIVNIQDYVAQAGQGRIATRENEHLGRSDVVLIMFRKMWERELRAFADRQPVKKWTMPAGLSATSGV
ncbi:MAG TPA: Rieske 2Fe-2S domain-containing protein [Chloroflexota bacterium]|nr:Rieske 2Fe-2S domain-containing protein [Chloroflexota bacterium]